ncbi:MAG: glycosyltransferase family 2 protein [Candidatus Diapherotrites archaeon]|uniref:Glycosyltransferase family 2 protein n=1 Tax=Candidatus Iainarchaeum sp. TaxID=3101447 RepID=A0A8T3YKT2_9ARCH|nr:glycosyltransferase family 2 protein [Candidatus Diapherotrites archaeon]
MKLVITIPAYNEEKTIGAVIREIPGKIAGVGKAEVLVIDDGSTDSTAEAAMREGAKVMRNITNKGLAFSFARGLEEALGMGADIIVNTDADFQYDQSEIPALVKPILEGRADIVLGSRFKGRIEYMPAQKYWGNKAMSFMVRFLTGLAISDAQTGFRAFSRDAALKVNIFSGYTYTQETILEAWEKGLTIIEVPVTFRKRDGPSRLISSIFVYARRAGFTVFETYLNYKPLKVFLSIGAVLIVAGLALGLRVLVHFLNTGLVEPYLPSAILSSMLVIVGLQVSVIGLAAKMLQRVRVTQERLLYEAKRARLDGK